MKVQVTNAVGRELGLGLGRIVSVEGIPGTVRVRVKAESGVSVTFPADATITVL